MSVDCIIKLDTASVVADSELGWFFFCGIKVKRFSGFSKIRWKGFHVKKRAKLDGTVCELKAADVLVDGHHWGCDVAGCDWTINMSGLLSWRHLFMIWNWTLDKKKQTFLYFIGAAGNQVKTFRQWLELLPYSQEVSGLIFIDNWCFFRFNIHSSLATGVNVSVNSCVYQYGPHCWGG